MHGEGVDVGEEAAAWVSEFLQVEGCQMYHMSPQGAPGRQTRVSLEKRWVIFVAFVLYLHVVCMYVWVGCRFSVVAKMSI